MTQLILYNFIYIPFIRFNDADFCVSGGGGGINFMKIQFY